jgi:tetratricopeptide (TPR) repeat protein
MKPRLGRLTELLAFCLVLCLDLHAQAPTDTAAPPSPQSAAASSSNPSPDANVAALAPLSPLAQGQQLYRTGKFDAAIELYHSISKSGPDAAAAYAGLAMVYLKQRKPAEAYAAASKAMDISPSFALSHTAMGEVLFRQGQIPDAEKEFLSAVNTSARDARAHLGLARVYFAASYAKHAKIQIDVAHELDPQDPDIQRMWIDTLPAKERMKALIGYLRVETDDDDDERGHLEDNVATMKEAEEQSRRGCRLVSTVAGTHMGLEKMMHDAQRIRGVGLKVQINGVTSSLLLDTGASGILIDRRIAEKAGLKSIVKSDVHGIGDQGRVGSFIAVADSIRIGEIEFQGCHLRVVEKRSVADGEGLIGADLFSHFLVDINIPDYKLALSPLPPLPPPSAQDAELAKKFPAVLASMTATLHRK